MGTDYTQDAYCEAAWLMEDSGNQTDSSSHARTATAVNTPTRDGTIKKFGSYSQNLALTSLQRFYLSNISLGSDFTLMGYVYLNTISIGQIMLNNGDEDNSGNPFDWLLGISATNYPYIHTRDSGGNASTTTSSVALSSSTWQHVVGQRQSSPSYREFVYVDGTLDATGYPTASSMGDRGNQIDIGVRRQYGAGYNSYMDANIDEFALFSRVLTLTEIQDIRDNGLKQSTTTTVVPLRMLMGCGV